MGCGMGELCFALADMGFRPIGVDISELRVGRNKNVRKAREWPQFLRCEACRLPFPAHSFDSAVSMQLIEHLHPEDVPKHLCEVFRVLKPSGRYTFETPHVLFGPHDVSRFFSDSPKGFHLKEYSVREILKLTSTAGFARTEIVLRYERVFQPAVAVLLETFCALLPRPFRRKHSFGLHNPFYIAVKDIAGS